MVTGMFAVGCLIICYGLILILHNRIGLLPFAFPGLSDTTTVLVIGIALVVLAVIFRIPVKK